MTIFKSPTVEYNKAPLSRKLSFITETKLLMWRDNAKHDRNHKIDLISKHKDTKTSVYQ